MEYDPADFKCLSIQALMLADYRGQTIDSYLIREYVKETIREEMQTRPDSLRFGMVTGLAYVGDYSELQPADEETTVLTTRDSGGSSNGAVPTLVSISSVIVLCGMILFLKARRSPKAGDNDISDLKAVDNTNSEALTRASVHSDVVAEEGPCNLIRSRSDQSEDTMNSCDASDVAVIPPIQFEASNTAAVAAGGASPKPVLPPRPPNTRRGSVKLKKKRRKKKRKKTTLKRVNSRENIDEMEPIRESEDEDSEIGSESGSEYTTDDDGSSNQDSGCTTPIRSRSLGGSRASSRASSPRLSPQDEMFPSDVFANFDFVIEAPDFPFPTLKPSDNKRVTDLKLNQRPDDMVSPIKEEKIRPIPPPPV